MIASAGPTIRTTSSMPVTNPPPRPTAPTTLAPGVVLTLPPFLANLPTPDGGFPVCYACGTGYFVKDKTATVSFSGITFICGDLEAAGLQGLIPAAFCSKSLNEAVLQACGCDEIIYSAAPSNTLQAATTTPNTPSMTASARPTIRSTASMPVANPLLLSPIAPSTPTAPITPTAPTTLAPGTVQTLPPFLANFPTPDGGFPVCYVCGIGYFVKDKNAVVTFWGLTSTCRDLEALGQQGLIPQAFCQKTLTEAVVKACGCDEIIYSAAPSSTLQAATTTPNTPSMTASARPTIRNTVSMPVANPLLLTPTAPILFPSPIAPFLFPTAFITPSAPTTLAPGAVLTFPPIVLADFPTPDGGFAVCPVCGNGFFVYNTAATVTLSGLSYTCNEIQALGFKRLIPDAFCNSTLLETVLTECGCKKAFDSVFTPSSPQPPTPPSAPFNPTAPTTLAPGVTFTIQPILSRPVCYVCGEGYFVKDKNASVILPGVRFTCRDLEAAGLQGLLPSDFCTDYYVQEAVVNACGCDEIINTKAPAGSSSSTTTTTSQVPTLAPNTTTAGVELTPSEAPSSSNTSQAATLAPTKSAGFTIMRGSAIGSVLATATSFLLLIVL